MSLCPVCGSVMWPGYEEWHYVCPVCKYEQATLQPVINDSRAHQLIDESRREAGLKSLRVANFRRLLARIKNFRGGGQLLEVGSAYGWFLDQAQSTFNVVGVEPDERVFDVARSRGVPVRRGYFPGILRKEERYDVIVFNDVIEHIPDIVRVLESCKAHLVRDGILVLNLPSSTGVFYRVAKILFRCGRAAGFHRMWQVGLPSPHLHYFNERNLTELLKRNGFDVRERGRLSALRLSGLLTRITYTGESHLLTRVVLWAILALALPLLRVLPSDIMYVIASSRADGRGGDGVG